MTTTQTEAARRVTYQLETLWDFDYEPTHDELSTLYENSQTTKTFNSFLFQENLMPRLQRLGLISERVAPRYRDIGLLG